VLEDLARVARAQGVPTLINIHAVDLARQFCDRIIGIAQGVVVFDGRPSELDGAAMNRIYRFDRPATPSAPPSGRLEPTPAAASERELAGSAR
jgi:phosphonate transport system ATP-binding protein